MDILSHFVYSIVDCLHSFVPDVFSPFPQFSTRVTEPCLARVLTLSPVLRLGDVSSSESLRQRYMLFRNQTHTDSTCYDVIPGIRQSHPSGKADMLLNLHNAVDVRME